MAQKPIRESQAKELIHDQWGDMPGKPVITFATEKTKGKVVAKVDECFGKRGKRGYVKVCGSYTDARRWMKGLRGKEVEIDGRKGRLNHFLIEPYIKHTNEYYLAFTCERDKDVILFSDRGGIEIEGVADSVQRIEIPLDEMYPCTGTRVQHPELQPTIVGLFYLFRKLDLSFLEINPLAFENGKAYLLDAVCRVDTTASFRQKETWERFDIGEGFGTKLTLEEQAIRELDAKTGSSLKFVLLSPEGHIWTMVAGGGASIIYADAITNVAPIHELANYGEWSGNPNTGEMEEYTRNILELMTAPFSLPKGEGQDEGSQTNNPHPNPLPSKGEGVKKALIIGGGIANFTDIKKTFAGVVKALEEYKNKLRNVKIYVRRAGPNDMEGLAMLQKACDEMGIRCAVFGAELPMTEVVKMATRELHIEKLQITNHKLQKKSKYQIPKVPV